MIVLLYAAPDPTDFSVDGNHMTEDISGFETMTFTICGVPLNR